MEGLCKRALLVAVAMLLGACAGARPTAGPASGAPAAPAPRPDAPAASSSAPGPRELIVTEPVHGIGYLPMYVAQRRGYFAEEGLNVVSLTMNGGGPDVNAVLTNQAWGHIGSPERVSNAVLKGGSLRIVGTIANRGLVYFVARPGLEGADLAAKLRGKRIATATFGGTPNAVTRYVLRQNGLDPQRDVTLIEMESSAMASTMERGQADILVNQEPLIYQGIVRGWWTEPFYGAPQALGPYLYTSLSVGGQSLRNEPDVVVAMLRGLVRGFQALQDGGPELATSVAKLEFPTMDEADLRATIDRSYHDQLWQFDGLTARPTEQAFNTMVDVGMLAGTFKDRIPFGEVVDTSFVERAHATLPTP